MDGIVAKAVPEGALSSGLASFERDLRTLETEVTQMRKVQPEWRGQNMAAWSAWYNMVRVHGPDLIEGILNNRVIPPGKAKALEMAARLLKEVYRKGKGRYKGPPDLVLWYDANHARLELVVQAVKSWPLKTEENAGEQLFKVGPFTVHNTVDLSGEKLATAQQLLVKTIAAARASSLPGFERVLYGEVFLVGQIYGNAKTLAWYNLTKDEISIRPLLKIGRGDVNSLVHELAHRYWDKFCPREVKQAFFDYDSSLRETYHSVGLPEAGKPLGLTTEKGKPEPIVDRVERNTNRIYLEGGSFVMLDSYLDIMRGNAKKLSFPTVYSSTKMTEHFAEAAALEATGDLTGAHLDAFKKIVKGQDPTGPSLMPTMQPIHTAGSYAHISREDFEEWLNSLRFLSERWKVRPGTVGVYVLPLSDRVAVEVSSSIGKDDAVMGKGMGSMQLRLVSRITGRVINKKAQGQGHFARTTNWRKTWLDGVERMRSAYLQSAGFYDAIAEIEDRAKYQRDILDRIEARANWQDDRILHDFHDIVQRDGVLTIKQKALLESLLDRKPPASPPPPPPAASQSAPVRDMLERTRDLWRAGRDTFDVSLMTFAKSVGEKVKAGHPLTPQESSKLNTELARRKLAHQVATRWITRR